MRVFAKTAERVVLGREGSSTAGAAANRIAAMSVSQREEPRASGTSADRGAGSQWRTTACGFRGERDPEKALHPTGEEDDHKAIFTEYAASDAGSLTLQSSYSCSWPWPDCSCSAAPCDEALTSR